MDGPKPGFDAAATLRGIFAFSQTVRRRKAHGAVNRVTTAGGEVWRMLDWAC